MAPFVVARSRLNTDSDSDEAAHPCWEAKHAAPVAGFETGLEELTQPHHDLLVPFNALFRGGASERDIERELMEVHGLYIRRWPFL